MSLPANRVRQKASIIFWRYIIRCTFIFIFLSLSTACASLQAQNNKPETSTQTEIPTSSRVVALGRIIPEGDVIKISVP